VTGDLSAAEDVVQDTLIAIVRKLTWLGDASLFRPWAYRIASRNAFRAIKKRRLTEPLDDVDPAVEAPPADPWQRERLLASLDRMSPASRAVVTLHYFEELPLSEVAAVLEISLGTVKSRLAYGLSQLRKENLA
jgi:RNA polymerase sigma-70 factor (ECF subfamily)